MKPPPLIGAWACHSCHDHVDRRKTELEYDFVRLAHCEGVMRTVAKLLEMEAIKC